MLVTGRGRTQPPSTLVVLLDFLLLSERPPCLLAEGVQGEGGSGLPGEGWSGPCLLSRGGRGGLQLELPP